MRKKIYHRNDVRPALIEMGLSARRLMYMWLASLSKEKNIETGAVDIIFDPDVIFEVKVRTYADMCNIDYSAAYRQIIEGIKDLMGFVLTLDCSLTKKTDSSLPKDWIAPFQIVTDNGTGYSKGDGFVKIRFNKKLAPLVSDLTVGFTGQLLQSAISIPESNPSKLYLTLREWVSSNKHVNEKILLLDKLKEILGVDNLKTYDDFQDFKRAFFQRAAKSVIQKTEFTEIKMEIEERRARKAYRVKISWKLDKEELEKKEKEVEYFQGKLQESHSKNKGKVADESKEELRLFGTTSWRTKEEAELHKLDWDNGLTTSQAKDRMINKFKK